MNNQLIKSEQLGMADIMSMGKAFQESGMFPDIKSAAMAIVKIQAGQEIGISPFAAMTGIHIIQGRPTIGAGLIASKVKGSGKYDYTVKEMTDKNCSLEFFEGKKSIGISSFSIEDAKKAQTKNMDKFPKNMLFARAISNGVKWFCPDVFNGPVYAPEDFENETENTNAEVVKTELKKEPEDQTNGENNEEKPFEIPGNWFAKMEKCKTKSDVLKVYNENKETIDANPELQKLLKETQKSFTLQTA